MGGVTGLKSGDGIAELHGFGRICVITGINKSTNGVFLMTKVLRGLCHVFLTVSLAGLEPDGDEKVCHFEVIRERLMGSTQTDFSGKPTI